MLSFPAGSTTPDRDIFIPTDLYPPPKLPERLNQTKIEKLSEGDDFPGKNVGVATRAFLFVEPRDRPSTDVRPRRLSLHVRKLSKIFRHFFFILRHPKRVKR